MPEERDTVISRDDVQITSKDGTKLAARVYLPDSFSGSKLPTVLTISPYNASFGFYVQEEEDRGGGANFAALPGYCDLAFFVRRGYAVVLADARGTRNSGGCFNYGGDRDREDGHAIVDWIARQDWSNGRVGMYGISAYGMSQYVTATAAPRALRAIIPVAPVTSTYRRYFYGGLPFDWRVMGPVMWEQASAFPPPTDPTGADYPQRAAVVACAENVPAYGIDPTFTEYWKERDQTRFADRIKAAVFHVQGTLDDSVTTDHFSEMWRALERADTPRKALVGPWEHEFPAMANWPFEALRWFEHWLDDNDTGFMRGPTVTAIDQVGHAHTSDVWPVVRRELVLKASDGMLDDTAISGSASFSTPPHTPRSTALSEPGMHVAYRSDRLRRNVPLSGTPVLDLVASLDGPDADFAVHLFSVGSSGRREFVSRGYLDAVHRNGVNQAYPVPGGKEVRYRIELLPGEYVFRAGHRIELAIAGADSCLRGQVQRLVGQQDEEPFYGSCAQSSASSGMLSDPNVVNITVSEGPEATALHLPIR